ncbi:hypothetical protein N7456_011317 [Penicillium angulare]|uniref:F-box domain-containing protein n=1 Tax=Penicillium angulare TaxID=116970 RepID=A0A9W9ETQ9_9EURO|nr:hypothetical protein N7456_011317 [Penicillium angulare]
MSILSLPVKLVSKICNHLDLREWSDLRLSCRVLYERSLDDFAETYYKRIRFIVTSESLHELEELSKSNGLREHVQELWMIPTVFGGTPSFMGMVSISSKSCQQVRGDELKARHAVCEAMVADSSNLLESETFSIRLRKCLDRFQKLQSVGLTHYKTEFLLDPRQKTVPFLGRQQMMSRIDFRFDIYSLQSITHTDKDSEIREKNSLALSKLVLALCGSSCRPRKLHTCSPDLCGDIGPTIALTEEQYDLLRSALKDIDELHLCIDLHEPTWLKLLTNVSPQLKKLTLSQDHIPAHSAKSYAGNMFHEVNFTRLRELHIHDLRTSFHSLKSLLIGVNKTLAILTLETVIIRSEKLKAPDSDHSSSQYSEYSGPQENESSIPLMPGAIDPVSSPFPQTSSGFHPTSPPYQPRSICSIPPSPYPPTVPANTTPFLRPTSPSFIPPSPSFTPTVPSYTPTLPLYTPTGFHPPPLSSSETTPAESALTPPQHSLSDESSEPISEQYPCVGWQSIYHPYIPQFEISGNVRAVGSSSMTGHFQPTTTCISSLLDLFQNNLCLQRLALEDIVCDNTYYCFKKANEIKPTPYVEFDIRSGDIPYSEWISHLRPVASNPGVNLRERADQG